jgi:alpha-tubulin suppressor-like RCC1 family protein
VAQGDGQSWLPAEALPLAVVIAVKDDRGNPTPDIAVSWEVTRGGGALEDASALTGASGQASAAWHLGPSVGENRLRVSVVGAEAEVVAHAKHPLVELVSGPAHVCGLDAAGAIHCWGNNDWGQLGDGTDAVRLAPVAVASADTFVALATGSAHTCALTAAGAAHCWGGNIHGQLGDGSTSSSLTPIAVTGGVTFTAITAGDGFTCALSPEGTAYCWGMNSSEQLGDASGASRSTPQPAGAVETVALSAITAGAAHTCGLTAAGVAYCWGNKYSDRLGHSGPGSGPGDPVSGGMTFASLAAGGDSSSGLTPTGEAYCWGYLWARYHFHAGMYLPLTSPTPTRMAAETTFTTLSLTRASACGAHVGGWVRCWSEDASSTLYPSGLGHEEFLTIAIGSRHGCVLTAAGVASCWGTNASGQLGDGTGVDSGRPVQAWP